MRGYAYGPEDVTAKAVANSYAQALGAIFTEQMKPFEVEVLVAQVGETQDADEMYRVSYDGTLQDEQGVMAMGGSADQLMSVLREGYEVALDLGRAVRLGAKALAAPDATRESSASTLEVALLDRARLTRAFRRISGTDVDSLLQG